MRPIRVLLAIASVLLLPLAAMGEEIQSPVMAQYEAGFPAFEAQMPDMSEGRTHPCVHITTQDGLALMIKTADCQPILLAHEGGRHILALHSGWRGSRADFAFAAVGEFCARYALDPAELWAVRGPSLGPAAAEFVNFAQEWGEDFAPWYCERWRAMDLWALTRSQLMRAGLRPERILGLDICTFEGHEMFFSHRHARKYGSEAGRQASLIWIVKK